MIITVEESSIVASFSCTRLSLRGAVVLLSFSLLLDKTEDLTRLLEDRERFVIPKGDIILFTVGALTDLKPRLDERKLFVLCADSTGCPLSL